MEAETNKENALKQALDRRRTGGLSSNFSYRTMERIHLEAAKQRKHRAFVWMISLISATLSLVGMGVYFLVFYLEFSFADYMPKINLEQDLSFFHFYVFIAVLVLILLGVDYWVRKKFIWK